MLIPLLLTPGPKLSPDVRDPKTRAWCSWLTLGKVSTWPSFPGEPRSWPRLPRQAFSALRWELTDLGLSRWAVSVMVDVCGSALTQHSHSLYTTVHAFKCFVSLPLPFCSLLPSNNIFIFHIVVHHLPYYHHYYHTCMFHIVVPHHLPPFLHLHILLWFPVWYTILWLLVLIISIRYCFINPQTQCLAILLQQLKKSNTGW